MEPPNNQSNGVTPETEEKIDSPNPSAKRQKCNDETASSSFPTVEIIEQILDDDGDMYQSINAELDKQIAEDMEAIKNYLNNPDESVAKRIEFFNQMDKTRVSCTAAPVTDHILYQHTPLGNIKWHECTQCEFKAQERSKLMEHLMTTHSSLTNGTEFPCSKCSFKAKVRSDLQRHLQVAHGEGFTCKECKQSFHANSDLLRHLADVHEVEIFKCGQCPFIAEDRAALRHHTLTEHVKLNVSWYKCAQCAYRTVRKATLDRHIMYKHSINSNLL